MLVGKGRHAACRDRGLACRERPAARLRADGLRAVARRPPGGGTIGGMLAANLSGPRRLKAGAARDHILGIIGRLRPRRGVQVRRPRGQERHRLRPVQGMAGTWGTLAVLTDVTFKVLPAAETETTLALRGLLDDAAAGAMALAMGSAAEVSSAAHLPNGSRRAPTPRWPAHRRPCCASKVSRLPSPRGSASLRRRCGTFGRTTSFSRARPRRGSGARSAIAGRLPTAARARSGASRWRPPPGRRSSVFVRREAAADAFYDWQGGLVWLRMDDDAGGRPCAGGWCGRPAAATRRWCARRRHARRRAGVRAAGRRRWPRSGGAAQAGIRSARASSIPAAWSGLPRRAKTEAMQTHFTAAQLADPAGRGIGEDPAQMRALRLLHGDLPDLCDARQRARLARAAAST